MSTCASTSNCPTSRQQDEPSLTVELAVPGGLTDRNNTPFGTWHLRYIDWFRDLGFLQASGIETRAAAELAAYAKKGGGGFKGKGFKAGANP